MGTSSTEAFMSLGGILQNIRQSLPPESQQRIEIFNVYNV